MRAREVDRLDDVVAARAARDHRRVTIEHAVPDLARLFVPLVSRQQQLAAQAGAKRLEVRTRDRDRLAVEADGRQLFGQLDGARIRPRATEGKRGGRQCGPYEATAAN